MAAGLEATQAAAEVAFRDTKCNAAGLPEPGHLIRSPLGAPECGPRNPNSTCMMDQCCSFAGYCGPIPDAQGRYFENGIQLSTIDATALYCNKQSYGDWRGWTAAAGTCGTIGMHYPVSNNLGWFGLAWPVIYAIGGGIAAFILFLTVIAVAICRRRSRSRKIAKKNAAATTSAVRSSADDEQARLRPGTPATTLQGTTLHGTVRSSPSMNSLRGMPGPPPSAAAVRRTPTPTSAFDSPARSIGPSRPSWEPRPYVGAAAPAPQLVVHGAGSAQPSLSSSARSAGPISLVTAPSPHASLQHARSVSPLPGLQHQQQPSAPGATAGPPGRGTGTPSVDMAASVHGWRVPSPAPAPSVSDPWTASPGPSLRVTIGPYAPPPTTYYVSPVGSSPIPPPPPVSTGWAGQPPSVSSDWVAPPLPPVTSGWSAAPPPPGPMPTEFEYAPPPQTFATGWAPAPRPAVSSPPAVDLELPPGTISRVSPPLPPPPPADTPVLPHYLRQWRAAAAGNPAGPSLNGPRRVLTSFQASRADELSVDAGAWVSVTRLFEDGWGLGRWGDDREGMFPLSVLAPRPEDAVLHALVRDMAALLDEDEWEDGGDASDVGGNAPALSAATMARATSTLSRCQSLVFPTRSRP
ncbi:hypothetical protein GGF32_009898 [Allomyces javanicus]|nr:hypothetical protein GGF32_009898 [Allomyces javanicus]